MTENEAKILLERKKEDAERITNNFLSHSGGEIRQANRTIEMCDVAIQALEEIQQYRTISTIEEFKALKDAEEQGLLLRLPCKVGDVVYSLTPFCEICEEYLDNEYACECCCRGNFVTETKFDYEMIRMFGKTVFLTQEEAEQELKQMGE